MKRFLLILLMILLSGCTAIDVIECHDNPEVAGICVDITKPTFEGIDDVTIFQGDSFDPLAGVTARDDLSGTLTNQITYTGQVNVNEPGTYILTYKVVDEASNEAIALRYVTVAFDPSSVSGTNYVINGTMNYGLNGYTSFMTDGGYGSYEIVDGALAYTIESVTPGINYAPRLEYQNIPYINGRSYYVSFEVKSEEPRLIEVLIGELIPEEPWFYNYSPSHNHIVEVTRVWQTVSFIFTMNHDSTANGCILFHLGAVGSGGYDTTVYFDNISIQEIN